MTFWSSWDTPRAVVTQSAAGVWGEARLWGNPPERAARVRIVSAAQQVYDRSETAASGVAYSLELRPGTLYRRFAAELEPQPRIYWLDLITSAVLGWAAFWLAAVSAPWSLVKLGSSFVATFALYRAVLFVHELAHLRKGALPGFEAAWNLMIGFPMLVPSLMYVGPHADHHRRKIFGTGLDPEYEPIARWSPLRILASGLSMFVVPPVLLVRWGILGPISWLIPPLRRLLIERASTLLINARYRRRLPGPEQKWRWICGEAGAASASWTFLYLIWTGVITQGLVIQYYSIVAALLMVNYARTLAAHRYDNEDGELDDLGQLLDSINLMGGSWLTMLSAPVGLRYHALHHFMPALPYHSLGKVNRALLDELPAGSPYRNTQAGGVATALRLLLRSSAGHQRSASASRGDRRRKGSSARRRS